MIPTTATRWVLAERDQAAEVNLCRELGIPEIVAALLVQRNMADPEVAHKFLNPSLADLHDPKTLPDYELAKNEILGAKERGELIFVHGDYDVDGVTSAAILHRFLKSIGANVETHVPHRMKEGYGIHSSAVEVARERGAKLFLTCDCGISAHDRVEAAKAAGMRVVVTDHHTIGDSLPEAHAIVNPHRKDSQYAFNELSGAGVVFKLCDGLAQELGFSRENFHRGFLDLAALGTIADVMPLYGENRIIAKFGLERLTDTKKVGIQALKQNAGINGSVRAFDVGFRLGPRINAVGRIDDSALALKLLLESDPAEAKKLADAIEVHNSDRKEAQQVMIDDAIRIVEADRLHEQYVIVVASANWHAGIVGLVAGRLVEKYKRPTFCFIIDEERGICKGSARSIPAFSVVDAIRSNPELLEGGGHVMAAGCSFLAENLSQVREALNQYARSVLTPDDFVTAICADLEVDPTNLDLGVMESLSLLEPYGEANPEPMFIARNVNVGSINPTRNPAHVQLTFRTESATSVPAIGFSMGERLAQTLPGARLDVLFQPTIDEFKGRRVKWQLRDVAEV